MHVSSRSNTEPFLAMDVLARAGQRLREGRPVISLAVGQPASSAPRAVLEAAGKALRQERIGYTDSLGLPDLRNRISDYYRWRFGLEIAPARVVVTTGSSAGFNLAFLGLFDPGDRVAITRPGYPAYRNILKVLGIETVEIPVGRETGFVLTPAALEDVQAKSGPLSGVLIASPANPTGTVTGGDALHSLNSYCDANDIAFISDEIYHGLTFDVAETTALALSGRPIVINSFSKYYCMTGWRIGWMVLPEDLVRPIERISQNLYISAPHLSQIAACEAFDAVDELEVIKDGYRRNREILSQRLPKIGLSAASPMDGAFYAYVDVSRLTNDSTEFARRMLTTIDVAVTPGVDFDPIDGHKTIRLSYAGSALEISEAMDRIEAWLDRP
jgi:aspartate/methionine/tyrosine aminotransferase